MRPAVAAVMALALASTILAGDGLVLVPHSHAPGTPAEHPHGLALYRFPIALLGAPIDAPAPLDRRSAAPAFRATNAPGETLAGASLLLTVVLVIAAVIPLVAAVARVRVVPSWTRAQWSASTPTGPPRPALLSA